LPSENWYECTSFIEAWSNTLNHAGAADSLTTMQSTLFPPQWALTNFPGESPNAEASSDAPPY
jgi:hypothetical protein